MALVGLLSAVRTPDSSYRKSGSWLPCLSSLFCTHSIAKAFFEPIGKKKLCLKFHQQLNHNLCFIRIIRKKEHAILAEKA